MEEAWPVHDYLSKTIWVTGGSLHKLDSNVKKLFSQRIDSWKRCGPVHDYLSKTIWETGGSLVELIPAQISPLVQSVSCSCAPQRAGYVRISWKPSGWFYTMTESSKPRKIRTMATRHCVLYTNHQLCFSSLTAFYRRT